MPGESSPEPQRVSDINLTNVLQYDFTQSSDAQALSDGEGIFAEIKNADPYASDSYDSLLQIKHRVNSLCFEFMSFGVYTEEQLNAIYDKEDQISLLQNICTHRPVIESGVFRDFSLTSSCALRVSREALLLVDYYKELVFEGEVSFDTEKWILLPKHYLQFLRHVYTNIGKMDALAFYFEKRYTSQGDSRSHSSGSSRIDYQKKVKIILIELLEEQYLNKNIIFNTIPAALEGIKNAFEARYELLQEKNVDQQYFHINHLVRNFQSFQRRDADFKKSASKYIKLKS